MAHPIEFQQKHYPLAAYNYRVKVGTTSMSFVEVAGLAVEYEQVTYRHGLTFREGELIETFAFDKYTRITCKRGTILGNEPLYLYKWLQSTEKRSMVVSLCDATGAEVLAWNIAYAVPVSLKATTFSVNTNEPAIDSVDLQVRGITLEQIKMASGGK